MRVVDWVAKRMSVETKCAFGVTGGCIVNMVDGFYKAGIKIVPMHHEQAAAMAADGYARVSGKIGLCFATSGPGGQNLLTGLACSYYDRVPVVAIIGQVPSSHLRIGNERQRGFQEGDNLDCLKSVSVYSCRPNAKNIKQAINAAIISAKQLRGPAVIELCDDIQRAEIDCTIDAPEIIHPHHIIMELSEIEDIISRSKRPVLVIGAGCLKIPEINIPKIFTWGALDRSVGVDRSYGTFGVTGGVFGNYLVKHSDLLICVGTRMDTHQIAGDSEIESKCLMVNNDISELCKAGYRGICCMDSFDFLVWLYETDPYSEWCDAVDSAYAFYGRSVGSASVGGQYDAIRKISDSAADNAVVVSDAGQTVAWTFQVWRPKKGQRIITAFNNSPMGYSLPAAIGAYHADPNRPVICIIGDGGFMMNIQELANIGANKWDIKIYVINNGGYGMIRQTLGDWDSLADSVACDEDSGLCFPNINAIRSAFGCDEIYDVVVDKTSKILPKLKFGNRLWDMTPSLPEDVSTMLDVLLSGKAR